MLDTSQFTGTEHWYRHPVRPSVTYTDGVKYVAEEAGAFWLIDKIALSGRNDDFQVWKLKVASDSTAILDCEDGDDHILTTEVLTFTDFPAPGITIWMVDNVILLPSEY